MDEEQPAAANRWRPRFSLMNGLLLTALVASGITIWLMWHEVGPLRAEVHKLRTELGYLNIDDPTRAYAIDLPTADSRRWKWRIYLPPEIKHRFCCYSGTLPSPTEFVGAAWFDRVRNGGIGAGSSCSFNSGEFTFEVALETEGESWHVITKGSGGHGAGRSSIYLPSDDWLSSKEGGLMSSGIGARNQTTFQPGDPILLLKVVRPIVTKVNGGYSTRSPDGAAEGFVVWIEEEKPDLPVKPAKGKSP
jgi:hypothetical protein